MSTMTGELRYAARSLAKSPGFAAVAILTLALGTGANTAIFSVVDAVLLKPLPFPQPERLFVVQPGHAAGSPGGISISPPEYQDIVDRQRTFEAVAAMRDRAVNITGSGEPERLQAFLVTANLPRLLRVTPLAGRAFTEEEGRSGGPKVAMIGEGLWRRRFAADPSAVGRTILLEGAPTTIVGILPREAAFPAAGTFHFRRTAQL